MVHYAYDGAFNIVSVSDPASGTVYAAFSGYNSLGQPGQIVFKRKGLDHHLYLLSVKSPPPGDEDHHRTVPAGTVQDMVYGYDSNGNVTSIADNVTQNNGQQFTYDGLNRLLERD